MTPDQIREVVKMTIEELTHSKLLELNKISYSYILETVEKRLSDFFSSRSGGSSVGSILSQLSDDTYIDIIFLQYRDGKTIEWIAEYMEKDESTIKRNKKRLVMAIYERLNK